MRDWRRRNLEKALAAEALRREKRREYQAAYAKEWYERNKPACKRRAKENYHLNKPRHYAQNKKWRQDNPAKEAASTKCWREANRHKVNAYAVRRLSSKRRATPVWANDFFIEEAYHLAKIREQVCGGKWHVDHIVPLQSKLVCGMHVENNLRVIPAADNIRKSNRHWPDMP